MNPIRIFQNTRMFESPEAAAEYLAATRPLSARGYVGPDGTVRLMVELDPRAVTTTEGTVRR